MEMMLHGMMSRCPVAMKILSLARRSGAVSYTHLDVYKRQGQTIPLSLFGSLALITLGYFVFHMTLAAWLFRKKEF